MRTFKLLPVLLITLLLGACDDIAGLGGRSMDGEWLARVGGEEVWMSLRDRRGEVRGSGEWGYDDVFVTGDRFGSDVRLVFDFRGYNPIEFEGTVRSREIEGRLYGSGLDGVRVRFYRD